MRNFETACLLFCTATLSHIRGRPSIAHVNASVQSAGFLCPFEANTYGIDFLSFQIEDAGGSGAKLFEISKDPNAPPPQLRVDGIAREFTLCFNFELTSPSPSLSAQIPTKF
jgi:hypothetical protein